MKKIYLLLLLIGGVSSAQVVVIPDANFKVVLLADPVINANGNAEIEVSEALDVTELDISSSNIFDLTGIEAFQNLTLLQCSYNHMSVVNVSMLPNLQVLQCNNLGNVTSLSYPNSIIQLECSFNNMTMIDPNGLQNLKYLICSNNQLTGLELSLSPNLEYLECSHNFILELTVSPANMKYLACAGNFITTMNMANFGLLEELYCGSSSLTALDVSGLSHLKKLNVANSQITEINLSGLPSLESMYLGNIPLTSLDLTGLTSLTGIETTNLNMTSLSISGLPHLKSAIFKNNTLLESASYTNLPVLEYLWCGDNPLLTTITTSELNSLTSLNCYNNQLTAIDLSTMPNLTSLMCSNNKIAALAFSEAPLLSSISCAANLLTTIDVSNNPNKCMLVCSENPNLTSVFMKNGPPTCGEQDVMTENENLEYVCTDEDEVAELVNYFGSNGMNVNVNSYCTFEPGGSYNTISGNVKFDLDSNGCDPNDIVFDNVRINLSNENGNFSSFTNGGDYKFYAQAGNYMVTPGIENPSFFSFSPANAVFNFPSSNGQAIEQNFCIIPNGSHQDLEIAISPIIPARPGFDAVYKIIYRNKGNFLMSQEYGVSFFYNQNLMSFTSADITPTTTGPGALSWTYSDLKPFESRAILVTMHINAPTDNTNPVNINDQLVFNGAISPVGPDENMADNYIVLNQIVIGSLDPNDIQCIEGEVLPPAEIGKYLHYVVRFENVGTFYAENIVVKMEIDPAKFNISTLQVMNSSHLLEARIKGNVAEFIFKNIFLDTGGHGNILLKIKSNDNLVTGDIVSKQADIFFDYNFPVTTNQADTVFQTLGIGDTIKDNSVMIYPNPAHSTVNIKAASAIKSIYLFDVQGRVLMTRIGNQGGSQLDISNYPEGIYFLKVATEAGTVTQKIVKK